MTLNWKNGTYKDVIASAKNHSSAIKQTLAAIIKKKNAPDYSKIVKLQKRNEFLFSKAKLKTSERLPDIYLTEDLTQLRYKLLNYVKTKCGNKIVMCNGKIRMKKCGKEEGNWIIVASPEDLFKLSNDIDFILFGYQPLFINRDDLIVEEA